MPVIWSKPQSRLMIVRMPRRRMTATRTASRAESGVDMTSRLARSITAHRCRRSSARSGRVPRPCRRRGSHVQPPPGRPRAAELSPGRWHCPLLVSGRREPRQQSSGCDGAPTPGSPRAPRPRAGPAVASSCPWVAWKQYTTVEMMVWREPGRHAGQRARCQSPTGQRPPCASSGIMASPPAIVDVMQFPATHCFALPLVAYTTSRSHGEPSAFASTTSMR